MPQVHSLPEFLVQPKREYNERRGIYDMQEVRETMVRLSYQGDIQRRWRSSSMGNG